MTEAAVPTPWWRRAVFYQVYLRSFADADGDGLGDLPGLRSRLAHMADLGVDALWITPFQPTPDADHGYDVADYCAVDPRFGTLGDLDGLLADAHALGLRVIVDLVPNHTSSAHPWFVNARRDPAHPDRGRYIWADSRPGGGPPNNWTSVFGGPAWTRDEATGQWYLHLFAPEQPDLNWRNPAVADSFDQILRFWLDRGVDGFRIDVAHGLLKDEALRDNPRLERLPDAAADGPAVPEHRHFEQRYTFDQEEVHDVYRRWRRLVDAYRHEPVLVGEVFLSDPDPARVARYVRADELHLAFDFHLLTQPWDADAFRRSIDATLAEHVRDASTPTWVLSNHDVARHATRYGGGELGRTRARAALLVVLALPGAVFLYQGEELGLEDVDVPPEARQDPIFRRGHGLGRDGCRVPMPWTRGPAPGYGFSGTDAPAPPWLPPPPGWGEQSVEAQEADPSSVLALYRRALAQRRKRRAAAVDAGLRWRPSPPDCLVFETGAVVCAANLGAEPVGVPAEGALILASDPGVAHDARQLRLPPSTAAWLDL